MQGIVIIKPDAPFGLPLSQDQWLYFFTLAVAVAALCWLRRQPGAQPHRPRHDRDPRQPDRGALDGHQRLALQVADLRRQRALHRRRRRARRHRRAVRRAGQLHLLARGRASSSASWSAASARFRARSSAALFVLFVPNIAEQSPRDWPGAVYGVILILLIYVMPTGAAGFVRLAGRASDRSAVVTQSEPRHRNRRAEKIG